MKIIILLNQDDTSDFNLALAFHGRYENVLAGITEVAADLDPDELSSVIYHLYHDGQDSDYSDIANYRFVLQVLL